MSRKENNTLSLIGAVFGMIFRCVALAVAVYIIYRGVVICYDYGYRIFTEEPVSAGNGRTVTVQVTEDMSAFDIGKLFESKGLVRDWKLFAMQYYLSEYKKDVEPGTFQLSTAMTAEEMMAAMVPATEPAQEE